MANALSRCEIRTLRLARPLAFVSAFVALIASCSIHEHTPVLASAGGTAAGAGNGGSGRAGADAEAGQSAASESGSSGMVGGANAAGGAVTGGSAGKSGINTGGAMGTAGTPSAGGTSGASSGGTAGTAGKGGTNTGGASSGGTGGASGATSGGGGAAGKGGASSGGGGAGGKGGAGSGGGAGCSAQSTGPEGSSCTGLTVRCGTTNDSCCTSLCVPGGTFALGGTVEAQASQATVSSYYLDKYEVTVGRFRKFLAAYDAWRLAGNPKQGAASHPLIAGSGWQATAWADSLPANSASLLASVTAGCSASYATLSASGANDRLPMNCVDWFQAFAFCAWDGGRLATEAEWEYAASGSDGRTYPWGSQAPTTGRASYGCLDNLGNCGSIAAIVPAGSKPSGAAPWGHLDLAGSMLEWVLDLYRTPYPTTSNDSATVTGSPQLFLRVFRSSGFNYSADQLPIAIRRNEEPTIRASALGLRCAR